MSDNTEYMREFMRLKRAAKRAGLAHLPVSELRDLAARGKLLLSTADNPLIPKPHATPNGHKKPIVAQKPQKPYRTPAPRETDETNDTDDTEDEDTEDREESENTSSISWSSIILAALLVIVIYYGVKAFASYWSKRRAKKGRPAPTPINYQVPVEPGQEQDSFQSYQDGLSPQEE